MPTAHFQRPPSSSQAPSSQAAAGRSAARVTWRCTAAISGPGPTAPQAAPAAAADDELPASQPAPRRVLLADDNRDAADSLGEILGLLGYDVRIAYDGLQAIALATATDFRPDVVVLDIGMPGLNGYEVAQRLRAAPRGSTVGLIALTGWGKDVDKLRAAEAGFDEHVTKPADPGKLADMIANRWG